jgi:hypothetical protein
MWSLGMVLYYLCYSRLPYHQVDDVDLLKQEILHFEGFVKIQLSNDNIYNSKNGLSV